MGHIENIVEAPEELTVAHLSPVGEDAEHLMVKGILGYTVVIVETCLCSPADIQGGKDVGL